MRSLNNSPNTILRTSQPLYGRDKEAGVLTDIFRRVQSGFSEIVMVKGHAGTGKTALVDGVITPLALEHGYFGGGKCDQFNTGVPYSPIIQAFEEVAGRILTEKKGKFEVWRKKLQSGLGPTGALIAEVIPRFKPILGPQPPIEVLPLLEAQNRFRLAFQKLINIFCAKEHPLTIFLDDLQWADTATLELVRYLISDHGQGYLLLVGAYRDNAITDDHPLNVSLDALKEQGLHIRELSLDDFNMDDTLKFTACALNNPVEVKTLAEQLYRKTGGNPLFLVQILKLLKDEGILKFDEAEGRWVWDMPALTLLEIPEDLVSLMTAKLLRLPEASGDLMKMAACIGSSFDLGTLSIACEKDEAEVISGLQPAIRAGLILPRTDAAGLKVYDFLHDRIQQAAYSLISENIKKELHLTLGMRLLQSMPQEAADESIVLIMDHCNHGLNLIDNAPQRLTMAERNLKAARKSRNSAAFKSSHEFLSAGISLLPVGAWQEHYRLTFDLHLELASCDYLIGNIEDAERLSDLILQYARSNQELAEIYNLKMVMYAGFGRRVEAVPFGMKALSLLGVNLPSKPGKFTVFMEILRIKRLLKSRKPEELFYLPDMDDPVKKSAMKLMSLLGSITISIRPNLYILLLLKGTGLALRFGNSEMSSVAYAVYAVVLEEVLGDYKSALAFEKLSIKLSEKYNSSYAKCIAYFVAGALVSHWTRPCQTSIDYLLHSVEYGMQSGELLYTGYSIYLMIEERYLMGNPLTDVDGECRKWYGFVRQMKLDFVLSFIISLRRLIGTLGGQEDNFMLRMSGELENSVVDKILHSDVETAARLHFFDMQKCYLYGRYEEALTASENVDPEVLSGFMLSWAYRFYQSLTITAVFLKATKKDGRRFLNILRSNLRRVKKLSDICPENFKHQYLLLSAEYARINGKGQKAMSYYDQAIDAALQNGFIQIAAIASESAARFYFSEGRDKIALVYLGDAIRHFESWGAAAKSDTLRQEFPVYMHETSEENLRHINNDNDPGVPRPESDKDSRSIMADTDIIKKVQNILDKRDPERQLEDVLNVFFEYAGARKGYLLLESEEELFIEAEKAGPNEQACVKEAVPMEKSRGLSHTVVRYVARTQETVVLHDVGRNGVFSGDTYLKQNCPETLICMPFLFQGILAGIFYMECREGAEAFTPARLDTMKQLCNELAKTETLQNYFVITKVISSDKASLRFNALTSREAQVLDLIAAGMSNKEIAEKLILSSNTIKMHLSNIYGKLQVQRRVQAVNRAKELGVLKSIETN